MPNASVRDAKGLRKPANELKSRAKAPLSLSSHYAYVYWCLLTFWPTNLVSSYVSLRIYRDFFCFLLSPTNANSHGSIFSGCSSGHLDIVFRFSLLHKATVILFYGGPSTEDMCFSQAIYEKYTFGVVEL